MKQAQLIFVFGLVVVLVYDAAAAFVSEATDVGYGWFSFGSFFIYALFGYLVGRTSKWWVGAVIGVFLGFLDSTVGWIISSYIGPGQPPVEINAVLTGIVIAFVSILAGMIGLIGGAVSRLRRPNA